MSLTNILLGITVLFFLILIIKNTLAKRFNKKICVICVSVFLTWLFLLILYYMNFYENTIILSILIGQSTLGIFYLFEKISRKEFTVFRLPFLLTLILIATSLIKIQEDLFYSIIFIMILWATFTLFYFYRQNNKINKFVNKIIECCKKW